MTRIANQDGAQVYSVSNQRAAEWAECITRS
jgi:hypothetical protein